MITYINCYLGCIWTSGLFPVILALAALVVLLFIMYKIKKNAKTMILAQAAATVLIPTTLALMICSMFALLWIYAGVVGSGAVLLGTVIYATSKRIKDTLPTPRSVRRMASRFRVDISIVKWPHVTAFAYKGRVFLSENLLHKLEPDEIKAVIAHEAYHARSGHNRMLQSLLGITSLTFVRHRDEETADRFAATAVGTKYLENALSKLEITGWKKRIAVLDGSLACRVDSISSST